MSIYNTKSIQKLPDILIYKLTDDVYRVLNTKTGSHAGDMKAFASKRNKFQNELWIDALILNPEYRNQGVGTKILKFAEIVSKQMGLKGRMGVRAATLRFISDTPPHKFYRKFGFKSKDKNINNHIDKYIQQNKQLDFFKMPAVDMTYTPQNQLFKQKIIDWFCSIFS